MAREWWAKAVKQGHEGAIKGLKRLDEVEGIKTTSYKFIDFFFIVVV